mmetsp:Transcript_69000/g.118486  ORF Transcript_69000/g.118486 Transcript_69000/m.118486 type:complete len:569 (+) Transcript_69000:37-1743(+)
MPPPAKKAHKIEPNEVDEVVPTKKTKDERERFWAQQERRRERFALPLDDSMYPQGDFDVVDASRAAGLTYDELVAVVHATGDTSLTCHSIMEDTIFDLIANQSIDGGSEGATLMDTKEVALPPMPKDCTGEPLGMPAIVLVPVGGGRSVAYALDDDPTPESTVVVSVPTPGKAGFTFEQLLAATHTKQVRQLIRDTEARSFIALLKKKDGELNEKNLKAFIAAHDVNENGLCEKQEWAFLFGELRNDQIEYYLKLTLLKSRLYQGFGLSPGGDARLKFKVGGFDVQKLPLFNCSAVCPGFVTGFLSLFHRGYWSDLAYFTANNHPLGVMLFSDPLHPFDESERQAAFAAAVATSFFGAALMVFVRDLDAISKVFISALFVTVPSTLIQKICYYLFAQPCLVYDESKASDARNAMFDQCGALATACGKVFVCAWSCLFLGLGVWFWVAAWEASELAYWAYGLLQFWVVWFAKTVALPFNPSSFVFTHVSSTWNTCTCGLVPLSVWFAEREEVEGLIREKVKTRGLEHFTMPGDPQGLSSGDAGGDLEAALGGGDGEEGPSSNPMLSGVS